MHFPRLKAQHGPFWRMELAAEEEEDEDEEEEERAREEADDDLPRRLPLDLPFPFPFPREGELPMGAPFRGVELPRGRS